MDMDKREWIGIKDLHLIFINILHYPRSSMLICGE